MADNPLSDEKHWVFRDPDNGDTREFVQRELTIDGEVQLFALVGRTMGSLNEQEFPWDELRDTLQVVEDDGLSGLDWGSVANMFTLAVSNIPNLAAETAAILLSIFPTTVNGTRNPRYEDEVLFIRRDMKISKIIDMLKVFSEQNDWKRLSVPFVAALRRQMQTWLTTGMTDSAPADGSPPTSTPSSQRATGRLGRSLGVTRGASSTST